MRREENSGRFSSLNCHSVSDRRVKKTPSGGDGGRGYGLCRNRREAVRSHLAGLGNPNGNVRARDRPKAGRGPMASSTAGRATPDSNPQHAAGISLAQTPCAVAVSSQALLRSLARLRSANHTGANRFDGLAVRSPRASLRVGSDVPEASPQEPFGPEQGHQRDEVVPAIPDRLVLAPADFDHRGIEQANLGEGTHR